MSDRAERLANLLVPDGTPRERWAAVVDAISVEFDAAREEAEGEQLHDKLAAAQEERDAKHEALEQSRSASARFRKERDEQALAHLAAQKKLAAAERTIKGTWDVVNGEYGPVEEGLPECVSESFRRYGSKLAAAQGEADLLRIERDGLLRGGEEMKEARNAALAAAQERERRLRGLVTKADFIITRGYGQLKPINTCDVDDWRDAKEDAALAADRGGEHEEEFKPTGPPIKVDREALRRMDEYQSACEGREPQIPLGKPFRHREGCPARDGAPVCTCPPTRMG